MRFEAVPGLDEIIAQKFVAPAIEDIVQSIRDAAARRAPDGKTWATVRDERVRPTHVDADMTLIPDNVPYVLHKERGGTETCDHPRDPSLSPENRYNCRCQSLPVAGVVAASLHTETHVSGAQVTGRVYTDFERAGESESAREGGGWLLGGAREVIAQRET